MVGTGGHVGDGGLRSDVLISFGSVPGGWRATSCTPDAPMTNVTRPPLLITTSLGKRLSRECPEASCPDGGGNGEPRLSRPNSIVAERAEGDNRAAVAAVSTAGLGEGAVGLGADS